MHNICLSYYYIGIHTPEVTILYNRIQELKTLIHTNALHTHPNKRNILLNYTNKMSMLNEVEIINKQIYETQTVTMKVTLTKMTRILKKLNFITDNNVLTIKGMYICKYL